MLGEYYLIYEKDAPAFVGQLVGKHEDYLDCGMTRLNWHFEMKHCLDYHVPASSARITIKDSEIETCTVRIKYLPPFKGNPADAKLFIDANNRISAKAAPGYGPISIPARLPRLGNIWMNQNGTNFAYVVTVNERAIVSYSMFHTEERYERSLDLFFNEFPKLLYAKESK